MGVNFFSSKAFIFTALLGILSIVGFVTFKHPMRRDSVSNVNGHSLWGELTPNSFRLFPHKDLEFERAFLSAKQMLELRLNTQRKAEPIDPNYMDAISRIEAMFDPTRVGIFGPALRMKVRPGTMSMTNVFGDGWTRASLDPNIHYRVRYQAETWFRPQPRRCEDFLRFRPDYLLVFLDKITPSDCKDLRATETRANDALYQASIAPGPLSVSTFAAPYLRARFTDTGLQTAIQERLQAIRDQMWSKRR